MTNRVIIGHNEGNNRGSASGYSISEHLWKGLNTEYTMDSFWQAVAAAMGGNKNLEGQAEKIAQAMQLVQPPEIAQPTQSTQIPSQLEKSASTTPKTAENGDMTVLVNNLELIVSFCCN